jgi:hypothetical protein
MAQNRQARPTQSARGSAQRDLGSILAGGSGSSSSSRTRDREPGSSEAGYGVRPPITDKRQASKLFAQGSFGNYVQQWDNLDEVKASGYKGLLVLRTRDSGGGGRAIYDLTVEAAEEEDFDYRVNYFNEQLNDQHKHVTIQGEVCRSVRGLEFRYCMLNLPMRPAMEGHSKHASGFAALDLLQRYCCPRGYDCIMELLDLYPDHVLEFTVFDVPCGALGWNTIVWEVRNY